MPCRSCRQQSRGPPGPQGLGGPTGPTGPTGGSGSSAGAIIPFNTSSFAITATTAAGSIGFGNNGLLFDPPEAQSVDVIYFMAPRSGTMTQLYAELLITTGFEVTGTTGTCTVAVYTTQPGDQTFNIVPSSVTSVNFTITTDTTTISDFPVVDLGTAITVGTKIQITFSISLAESFGTYNATVSGGLLIE